MGILVQAKNDGNQFSKYNFHATNEKLCHGMKGHPFFLLMGGRDAGWGSFFFQVVLVWRVDYTLFTLHLDS